VFSYLELLEHVADWETQPPPPSLPQTDTYPSAVALLNDCIAEPWECDAYGLLEMNQKTIPTIHL